MSHPNSDQLHAAEFTAAELFPDAFGLEVPAASFYDPGRGAAGMVNNGEFVPFNPGMPLAVTHGDRVKYRYMDEDGQIHPLSVQQELPGVVRKYLEYAVGNAALLNRNDDHAFKVHDADATVLSAQRAGKLRTMADAILSRVGLAPKATATWQEQPRHTRSVHKHRPSRHRRPSFA